MYLLYFLIAFPLLSAALLIVIRNEKTRSVVVKASGILISIGAIALLATNLHREIQYFAAKSFLIDKGMFFIEVALAGYIFYAGIKYKRPLTSSLIVIQTVIMVVFEIFFRQNMVIDNNLFIDRLSIIMALVVGIIGSLVAIYAIGYMRDLHHKYHKELKDNRPFFFFVIFVFLSAMFGIVFSNNITWLYFFWELTTLASFLLIGYKKTDEARKNSFHALELNLLAGIAFAIAIVYLYFTAGVAELDKIIDLGKVVVLFPVALLCFSGLIKAAQFPFSSWLIGAMVGPTPVSALLHSSTMVKAGVYIMLRFSPVLQNTVTGFMLALIGGVTFLIGSLIAISQRNSKGVLAYSTVANLGLIVLCAGVATYEAMWAAILLIIFHAVAKCLLFLCVGTVDNQIHSTNIEDMQGLIVRMPRTSIMMQIGMAAMFLAPFGMLISKWAALQALVDYNPLLAAFVVFGGSAMLFFWVKWIGKLITVTTSYDSVDYVEGGIELNEWIPLYILSFLAVGICAFFPIMCKALVEPYLIYIYGTTVSIGADNIIIMAIMFAMVALFPLSFLNYGKRVKVVDAYLGGANIKDGGTEFQGSAGAVKKIEMENYYLGKYFGERKLFVLGLVISIVLTLLMIGFSIA
ncbi:NADH-quinone oxidoreductase subunit L [Candidatus Omnitrophota bacterium]